MNREELQRYLSEPIKQNSMYDNDVIKSKTRVFDHYIGVTYRKKYPVIVRDLQRPGIKNSGLKSHLIKILGSI